MKSVTTSVWRTTTCRTDRFVRASRVPRALPSRGLSQHVSSEPVGRKKPDQPAAYQDETHRLRNRRAWSWRIGSRCRKFNTKAGKTDLVRDAKIYRVNTGDKPTVDGKRCERHISVCSRRDACGLPIDQHIDSGIVGRPLAGNHRRAEVRWSQAEGGAVGIVAHRAALSGILPRSDPL